MKRNTIARGLSERPVDGGDAANAVRRLQRQTGVRPEPVKEGDMAVTLNEELIPVVRELRAKANLDLREKGTATTAGTGAWTELWRSPELETNGTYYLFAEIKWSSNDQAVWASGFVSNTITSANGAVSITSIDSGELSYTALTIPNPRWIADAAARCAVLQFADDGATVMTAHAVVTMSAREL